MKCIFLVGVGVACVFLSAAPSHAAAEADADASASFDVLTEGWESYGSITYVGDQGDNSTVGLANLFAQATNRGQTVRKTATAIQTLLQLDPLVSTVQVSIGVGVSGSLDRADLQTASSTSQVSGSQSVSGSAPNSDPNDPNGYSKVQTFVVSYAVDPGGTADASAFLQASASYN